MQPDQHDHGTVGTTSRRALLGAAGAAGLAGTAGCLNIQRARALFGRDSTERVTLTIKTLPTDADPWAIRTARFLADKLEAVGIGTKVVPTGHIALLRDVLVNQSFDLYVARAPAFTDPDYLRSLLHSKFGSEPGWQNPFGYANLATDDLLVAQRRQTGDRRRETLKKVQNAVVRDQPFSVVAYPDEIHAHRNDRFQGWGGHRFQSQLSYLTLEPPATNVEGLRWDRSNQSDGGTGTTSERARTLRMTTTDSRAPENMNPLAVEYRSMDEIVGLLYDPLGQWIDGQVRPWLAEEWTWQSDVGTGPTLDVSLRDDLSWHDGTAITAHDVAFTYQFLKDTSMGGFQSPLPAPRFRGRSSLVEDVAAYDDETVRIQFVPSSRWVASRSLTVPVLPAHVWRTKTERATLAGVDSGREVTEAVIWNNREPMGSGPLAFDRSVRRELVALEPADEHFLYRDNLDDHLAPYQGGLAFDRLEFLVTPSGSAAVELVQDGTADGTATGVTPSAVPRIGRSDTVELSTRPSRSFYHVGFNVRKSPYGNPRFRRAVARLLDKQYLVESVFDGYASPAATPLAHHRTRSDSLSWTGQDPELPFPGDNGELDVERARKAFREAGYRYTEDGKLVLS